MYKIILLITSLAFALSAKSNICKPTPNHLNDDEPANFPSINNLLSPTGLLEITNGKKIILQGRILDKHCKVISNAKVYLWQVDDKGKYPYKPLRTYANEKLFEINKKSTFQGAGISSTDNLGVFNFVTIYPKSIDKEATPTINIRVDHYRLGSLQTKVYLNSIKPIKNSANNLDVYQYDIVMPVINTQIRY